MMIKVFMDYGYMLLTADTIEEFRKIVDKFDRWEFVG